MLTEQAERAAAEFMRHKGYGSVTPVEIEEVEGIDVWYFYYDLAEGALELEVEWDGSKWLWGVMDFVHHQDKGETLVGSGR